MSVNRRRGEVAAELDGKSWRLRLTLGALAELEDAFHAADLSALVSRFSEGRLSANDMVRIIGAGLRAAGNSVTDDDVCNMHCANGAAGYAAIVAELLTVTFGGNREDAAPQNP